MREQDYALAEEAFRRAIGSGPMQATLLAAAIACDEARAALRWAGHPDDALMKDLGAIKARLQAVASEGKSRPVSTGSSPDSGKG